MAPRTSTNFAVLDESITVWGVVLPAIFAGAQSSSVAELAWLCGLALCAEVCRQKLFESSAAIVTARHSPKRAAEWDADVIVVGAGVAGASLATTLARSGNRVMLIERRLEMVEPAIIGELLQPGGLRALERMGLAETATDVAVDSVTVEGYVCITPATDPSADIVLSYPEADPNSAWERIGFAPAKSPEGTPSAPPRGRSFHNSRFVHQLRRRALAEPLVSVYSGRVTSLVRSSDPAATAPPDHAPPPRFAGYDAAGKPIPSPRLPKETSAPSAPAPATSRSSGTQKTDAGRVVGVAWVDEHGQEQVARAPLTVVADGRYSTLRPSLTAAQPRTVSFMVGYLLRHPAGAGPRGVLPYPKRGHVVLADPGIVLLYQISASETRALVDVPAPLPSVGDGSLQRFLTEVVSPQLPAAVRGLFDDAVRSQEPVCMPTKYLPTSGPAEPPSPVEGALLLGDSWNMRHPITGGGMTVALRDAEALAAALRGPEGGGRSIAELTDAELRGRIARFRKQRLGLAGTINILANALHSVFSVPPDGGSSSYSSSADPLACSSATRASLRAACLEYFQFGGSCVRGPVGMLAGLTPSPAILIAHFFFVAAVALRRTLRPRPTWDRLRQSAAILRAACAIIMPLLREERVTALSWPAIQRALRVAIPWQE